jgi:hypothetical protein
MIGMFTSKARLPYLLALSVLAIVVGVVIMVMS